jgi:Flp pilus assembly pilin Flp
MRTPTTDDDGSTTVEYAIVTVAVAAFAAVLYTLLTGDSVVSWLTSLVMKALSVPS